MKKFYSFLFAAVALVGFAACNSDSTEEPAPAGVEKVSFTANIEETKTALDGLQTIWCEGDVVMIDNFEFVTKDGVEFTCTQTGCMSLLNKTVTAVYSYNKDGKIDSAAGVHGALLTATSTLSAMGGEFNFAVQNAFLKLTTTGTVTLKADQAIFSTGTEYTIEGENKDAVYVAINPLGDVKLSCESFGKEVKPETDVKLDAKKIYNLGNLEAATFTVYVTPQPKSSATDWSAVNIYAWNEAGWNNTWPGISVTENTEDINGYTYYKYTFPAKESGSEGVSVIVNKGTAQTPDIELGTLDKDYYVVYSVSMKEVYTEAPAAGSIEEYVAPTKKLYLKPQGQWIQNNERYAAYFYGGISGDEWKSMTDEDNDGIYECVWPDSRVNVIFCRMNGSEAENKWGNKWNQTVDLTLPTNGNNMFTINEDVNTWDNDNDNGTWSTK